MAVVPWRRRGASGHRRTGPADETRWWDPTDQAFAEQPILHRRDLGRGWIPVPMMNNAERLDPFADDPASDAVRAAAGTRRRTALDEGAAWRRRQDGALAVARVEVFADDDPGGQHRAAWRQHGPASLDATWRERWRERERTPGWIEARWRPSADRPDALRSEGVAAAPEAGAVDWLTIDDHTEAVEADAVATYEHLSIWRDRVLVTLTFRHRHGDEIDEAVVSAVLAAVHRIDAFSRTPGARPGSA